MHSHHCRKESPSTPLPQGKCGVQEILFDSFLQDSPQGQHVRLPLGTQVSRINPDPFTCHWKPSPIRMLTSFSSTLSPTALGKPLVPGSPHSILLAHSYLSALVVVSSFLLLALLFIWILSSFATKLSPSSSFQASAVPQSAGIGLISETREHLAWMTLQY